MNINNIYTVNEHNLSEWRRGRREALEEAIQRLTEKLKEDFPESPLVNSGNEAQRLRAALELAMPIVEHQSPTRAEMIREALSTTESSEGNEVQRLRAALKEILALIKEIRNYEAYSWNNDRQFIESRLNKIEALSASTTEQTGAERVRELWALNTEEGNRADEEYLAGIVDTLNALGYKIPGINAPEKESAK